MTPPHNCDCMQDHLLEILSALASPQCPGVPETQVCPCLLALALAAGESCSPEHRDPALLPLCPAPAAGAGSRGPCGGLCAPPSISLTTNSCFTVIKMSL